MDGNGNNPFQWHLLFAIICVICSAYPEFIGNGVGGVVVLKGKCVESEKQALLDFKQGLVDKFNLLSSWGGEEGDCCLWRGVGCHNQTGNIIKLDLSGCYDADISEHCLSGKISNSLLKLRHLRYLDLSGSNFLESIPSYIGSLSNLRYLNFSSISYPPNTVVPVEISNLSHLHTLDLSNTSSLKHPFSNLQSSKLGWLSRAYSLKHLDLSSVDLSRATDWLLTVAKLPSLSTLNMQGCFLPPPKLLPLSHVNISNSLQHIDLKSNNFNNSHIYWLPNITRNATFLDISHTELWGSIPQFFWAIPSLVHLDLSKNNLEGKIPDELGYMMSLQHLDLSLNNLEGKIPGELGNITSLQHLDLSLNNLEGKIPDELGNITSLQHLDLSGNNFQGVVPQLGMLPNLRVLRLRINNVTSILPGFLQVSSLLQELLLGYNGLDSTSILMESIGRLSNLKILDISSNPSNTVITQAHLNNLSTLQQLYLSSMPLNISLDWVPPFQLQQLDFSSCSLGPHFPQWLQTQNNISLLDLSNNGISATIPDWFWNVSNPSSFTWVDLSRNDLSRNLSTVSPLIPNSTRVSINLSSNNLSGPIPPYLLNVTELDLSNNFFSGSISVLCTNLSEFVGLLDLSNNSLSGELPDCWTPWTYLEYLNLADNNFSGNIPESMGSLSYYLQELHLRNNNLSGELPSSLMNCTQLEVLDVMENNLLGNIPIWIGESLGNLVVLSLRSNVFHGNIPPNICKLQRIQILDLSLNNMSGGIPWCFDNFTSMSSGSYFPLYRPRIYPGTVTDFVAYSPINSVLIDLKGIERIYTSRFTLIKLIDLSSNKLTGEIPHQITNLVYLISLNLSRNCLSGGIPITISNLSSLDTLDLSRNQLSGKIPSGLSALSHLGTLNLSYNNLSGRIPLGTQLQSFDSSVYQGNSGLCGPPLAACHEDRVPDFRPENHSDDHDTDDDELLSRLPFYIGAILGFIVGFWGVFGSLVMKRSWRIAYFQWLSRVKDDVYVKIALGMARVKRTFQ